MYTSGITIKLLGDFPEDLSKRLNELPINVGPDSDSSLNTWMTAKKTKEVIETIELRPTKGKVFYSIEGKRMKKFNGNFDVIFREKYTEIILNKYKEDEICYRLFNTPSRNIKYI
jgi:hypothetical protein